jgi:hypothetical protein
MYLLAVKPNDRENKMSENEKAEAKSGREKEIEVKEAELKAQNDKRIEAAPKDAKGNSTYKGTLLRVGQTRGKNPQMVVWEAFDEAMPHTLPSSLDEFVKLTQVEKESDLVSYVIDGYNSAQYTQASDPVAEFVEASWSEDVQKQFRMAVRNYANAAEVSIEDAATLIKPGIVKSVEAKAKAAPVASEVQPVA